ncbi:plasma membrane fusion protein prm1 [Coemansia thaxteri]|nr:plasma membrane fusion protein prm1 [Coemansia thaxteri]
MAMPVAYGYENGNEKYDEKAVAHYHDTERTEQVVISPYIGKWARISRAWATHTVVLLVFTAIMFMLSASDARTKAEAAIAELNSVCLSLQSASETVVNSPRSVGITTVTMIQTAAQSIIDLTGRSLLKIVSMLQTLIVWVLRMYLGTYICIAEVIIRTALSIAADVSKVLTEALNVAVNTVVSSLQGVAASIASGIQDAANGIAGFFTGNKNNNPVNFNIDDIRKNLTIAIPTDWINSISGLADKIPTESQIFGNITDLLNIPFNLMTSGLTSTFANARVDLVNTTHFPAEKTVDMCSTPIGQDTINAVGDAAMWIMYIAGFALLGAAFGVFLFEVALVVRHQNRFQTRLTKFRKDLTEYGQNRFTSRMAKFRQNLFGRGAGLAAKFRQDQVGYTAPEARWAESGKEKVGHMAASATRLLGFRDEKSDYKDHETRVADSYHGEKSDYRAHEARVAGSCHDEQPDYRAHETRMVHSRQDLVEYVPPVTSEEIEQQPATRKEMDFFVLPGRPWFDRFTTLVLRKFGDSNKTAAWRWYMDYIWHPPAIACFVAGALGLTCILLQIAAINRLRGVYIPMLAHDLDEFQYKFLDQEVLGAVRSDSIALANTINGDITTSEGSLNRTLFGPINDGTTSLNNTLNDFVSTYTNSIRSVFAGTPLEYPVEGLVNCTLTKNIQSVQKVLTFVHDYASGVDLPRVSDQVLYDPVHALLSPVNKTVNRLREFAVGVYVPNVNSYDPMSFPPEKELSRSKAQASRESKQSHKHSEGSSDVDSDSDSLLIPDSSSTPAGLDAPAAAAGPTVASDVVLLRRDDANAWVPNIMVVDSLPIADANSGLSSGDAAIITALGAGAVLPPSVTSPLQPELASLGTDVGGGDSSLSDDLLDDLQLYNTLPTSDLSREDIEDAQTYGGYTGGVLGSLCDSYVSRLKAQIPLMVALMGCWVVVLIMGLFHLASDLRKIKRNNLR